MDNKLTSKLLRNLWPAALTGLLIACASSAMKPALATVPELLEYTAPVESSTAEKPKLKDTATLNKLAKSKKKKSEKSTSEAFADQDSYTDGIYTGSAQGFGGQITVQVTVTEGKISDVTILSAPGETESYFARAKSVLSQIISTGSPNVDTVSGATYSSNGILNAVKRALINAGGSALNPSIQEMAPAAVDQSPVVLTPVTLDPSVIPAKPVNTLRDGTYTGSAQGFGGAIELEITVKDGKLVQLKILSAENETPVYFNKAKAILAEILNQQSSEVDVVSGATFSSEGILEALKDAMNKAVIKDIPEAETDEKDKEKDGEKDPEEGDKKDEEKDPEEGEKKDGEKDSEESENPDPEEERSLYYDGIFSSQTLCTDAEEDPDDHIFWYTVNVSITIEDGKITDVTVIKTEDYSETPEDNETYFSYALNGRTRKGIFYQGVVPQILACQSADEIDTVSSATYTSNAMIRAAREALTSAKRQEEQP